MPAPRTIALPERYRVEHRIATGGMASVWAAHDEVLRRRVAVKVLSAPLGEDPDHRERFAREARAAASIAGCGHVVVIYDIGEHDGRTFIVMEHFGGGTVADRVREHGLVDHDTALRWLREAAIALDCAHQNGIVHRDVKPANLLLDDTDRLAVADFGIAHVADATRQLTAVGTVVGTASYLSPEQVHGEPATAASDRYALAVVAFELLCGERPYQAEHPAAQALQHVEAPVPRITDRAPHLSPAVDAVVARGMAKDPAQRPSTSAHLVDELERALHERPPAGTQVTQPVARPRPRRPARTPPAAPRPARRGRRLLVPALIAVVVLVAAGTTFALTTGDEDEPTRSTADTTTTRQPSTATTPPATATTPAPPATQPAPVPDDGRSPSQLNDEGFALVQQQRYAEAIPLLQRAVEGHRAAGSATGLPYAYALYNLASALARAGRPAEAVPLLQERLRVSDNQRGVVRKELRRIQGEE